MCAGLHLEVWAGGGRDKTILMTKMGGGGGNAHNNAPSRGSGGMFSHKIVEFIPSEVHFQTHLYFSNDMMR